MKAATLARLGVGNVLRVAAYRTALKLPISPIRRQSAAAPRPPFFKAARERPLPLTPMTAWEDSTLLFGYARTPLSARPPDWHGNPLTGQHVRDLTRPWWAIPDFDPAAGDIKGIWELSRFDWVLAFAQRARNGDTAALEQLNGWLADWSQRNPPYLGPNWKCGQEASIRVMHLAMAQILLGRAKDTTEGLRQMVAVNLRRIAPTTSYAVGQANNHGTSEATALFIGGSWLGGAHRRMAERGRILLEDRVATLVQPDGSFSQYSVNYHRLVLDTLCMAEVWRRRLNEAPFSPRLYQRASAATEWLRRMTNPEHGDAPNIGANDGAKLLRMGDEPYRDHRPTLQLSSLLFLSGRAFPAGPWDTASVWLGVPTDAAPLPPPISDTGRDGGFAVLRRAGALAVLRHPRFRFRPSQSDLLHLDLWADGENILRDGGTYSYNTESQWLDYFSGVRSHNTVEFDGRDQMPRIGRFLFGAWPSGHIVDPLTETPERTSLTVGYRDSLGAAHKRRVELSDGRLTVSDEVSGFSSRAVLRWRLRPGAWRLERDTVTDGRVRLRVTSTAAPTRFEITQGWESRRYLEMTEVPVLEVEVQAPAMLITECTWRP